MPPADRLIALLGADPRRAAEIDARLGAVQAPGLPHPDDAFAEAVAGRIATLDELAGLHLADLFVAHLAARGHAGALAILRRTLDGLRAPLRRTGADAQQIDELLADLPADLVAPRDGAAPRILGYAGKGPLGGWLRVVAVRMLVDRRRATRPTDDDQAVEELAAPDHLDPELALLRHQYAAEFRAGFLAAIAALAPTDRLLLRQHHVDGLGIDRLAVLHGIHRATAARRLVAIREAVFDSVRRRLLAELRIGGQTFDSLLRLVQSELDLSIHRYL